MEKFIKIAINVTKYGSLQVDKNGNQWINVSGFLKDEKDKFGNNGFVKRNADKDESAKDMPIVGNFCEIVYQKKQEPIKPADDDSDLPF